MRHTKSNKYDNGVNVRQFGAAGNGVTDDTAALHAAIAGALAIGHKIVSIPPGTYVTDRIDIKTSGVEIIGAGPNASILKSRTGDDVVKYLGNAGSGHVLQNLGITCYGSKQPSGDSVTCVANGTTTTLKVASSGAWQCGHYVRHPDVAADQDNWHRIVRMRMSVVNGTANLYTGVLLVGAVSKSSLRVAEICSGSEAGSIAFDCLTGAVQAGEELRTGSDTGLKACDVTADTAITLHVDRPAAAAWDANDAVRPYYGGHGIHVVAAAQAISAVRWENLRITNCQGSAIMTEWLPLRSMFSVGLRNIITSTEATEADHAINLCGASVGVVLDSCYVRKLRSSVARPTYAYRIDSHEPVLIACNAVDDSVLAYNARWGLFGSTSALDGGYAAQCRPTLLGCNIEHWENGGTGVVLRSNSGIYAEHCRWLHDGSSASKALEIAYLPSAGNIIKDCVITSTGTGGWVDGLPIHSSWSPVTGETNLTLLRSGETQFRHSGASYAANLGAGRSVNTIRVTVGTEASDVRRWTVQVYTPNGTAATGRFLLRLWQSAANFGAPSAADNACTTESVITGTMLQSLLQNGGGADMHMMVLTDATGKLEWDIMVPGDGQRYVLAELAGELVQGYATYAA